MKGDLQKFASQGALQVEDTKSFENKSGAGGSCGVKTALAIFVAAFMVASLSANTLQFKIEDGADLSYLGVVTYNEEVLVGDAIFARLQLNCVRNKKKVTPEVKASLMLLRDDKKIDSAKFYSLKSKKASDFALLSSIPITLWAKNERSYNLKVLLSFNTIQKEVVLPLAVVEKKFFSETLDLNDDNSLLKQQMTAERAAQIEELNKILGTIDESAIYSLSPFIRPVKSERMTAHFGDKRLYKYTNGKSEASSHYGNDYGVPEKTDVFACANGKVVLAKSRVTTGYSVVIEHLPGLYSLYYHMSKLNVKVGDTVRAGSKIGLSGSTGFATGPHLHWEVRLNMAAVAPEFFMKDFTYETNE